MSRRVKSRIAVLVLLCWQTSLGFMLPASSLHAQVALHEPAVAAQVAESQVHEQAAPCHGEESVSTVAAPPIGVPPCCQSHGCQGDCFACPAIPSASAEPAGKMPSAQTASVPWHKPVPPPLVEFFRPPI